MDVFGGDLKTNKEFEVNEIIKNIKHIKQQKDLLIPEKSGSEQGK